MFVSTALGILAAIGFARRQALRGARALHGIIMIPLVLPSIITAVSLYTIYLRAGLLGTWLGFAIAHIAIALPLTFVPIYTSLRSVDYNLLRAARTLGASPWRAEFDVRLKLMLPGILTGALFAFAVSFDEVVVSLFIQSPIRRTLPVQMFTSVDAQSDPTIAAVSTVLFVIVTIVCVLIAVRSTRARD